MSKMYTYEIERVTHGIDRYYVELWDDGEEPCDGDYAITLCENGEIMPDSHEDLDWGPFEVTDVQIEEYEDEED